ncbi:MAG TPA: SCO family protein [Bacteroidota bacterium]
MKLSVIFLSIFVLTGCGKQDTQQVGLVTFPLKGIVEEVDTAKMRVTIAHEEIPDYMMAMTMPFKVKDRSILDRISPGDSVQGTLAVSRTESWLENLDVLGHGEPPNTLEAGDILAKRLFKTGDYLPNITLINQDEKNISISQYRGKMLALSFIFTRCPLPDFCIRMSDNFSRLERELGKQTSLAGQWHLLTVSFDPKFDSPKVLKQYGENYGADFTTWDFATAPVETLRQITDGLDLMFTEEDGLITHNLRTVLIDRKGRIVEIIKGNEWTVAEFAATMKGLASAQ